MTGLSLSAPGSPAQCYPALVAIAEHHRAEYIVTAPAEIEGAEEAILNDVELTMTHKGKSISLPPVSKSDVGRVLRDVAPGRGN